MRIYKQLVHKTAELWTKHNKLMDTQFFASYFAIALFYIIIHEYLTKAWTYGDVCFIVSIILSVFSFKTLTYSLGKENKVYKAWNSITVTLLITAYLNFTITTQSNFVLLTTIIAFCIFSFYEMYSSIFAGIIIGVLFQHFSDTLFHTPTFPLFLWVFAIIVFILFFGYLFIDDINAGISLEWHMLNKQERAQFIDAVTGMYNERYINMYLNKTNQNTEYNIHNMSIGVIAVSVESESQAIKDDYHVSTFMQDISTKIRGNIRRSDTPCIYNHNIFIILMPNTAPDKCKIVMERIQNSIKNESLIYKHTDDAILHINTGVSSILYGDTTRIIFERIKAMIGPHIIKKVS